VSLSRVAFAVLVTCSLALQSTAAQQTARALDISKLGPQVGQQVPNFSLNDQTGKTWTRQSILGSKGAMLVFIRSADW
jgi:cytochrome oxidase Cu insertion factor (SCO1/SenC/PrrC family)